MSLKRFFSKEAKDDLAQWALSLKRKLYRTIASIKDEFFHAVSGHSIKEERRQRFNDFLKSFQSLSLKNARNI